MSLVTSVSSKLRQQYIATTPIPSEELQAKKLDMIRIADTAIAQFEDNLNTGHVKLETIADFERLVKLMLLLSGEADKTVEVINSQQENTASIDLSTVLDKNDPAVQALYEKMFNQMNQQNNSE